MEIKEPTKGTTSPCGLARTASNVHVVVAGPHTVVRSPHVVVASPHTVAASPLAVVFFQHKNLPTLHGTMVSNTATTLSLFT